MTKYIAVLAASLLFVSCASVPTLVWDDKIPETERASVYWYYGLNPVACNGVAIKQYKMIIGGPRSDWENKNVVLPAGDIEIELNLDASVGDRDIDIQIKLATKDWGNRYAIQYKGAGFVFRYRLEPETQYVFMFARNEKNHWGVNVYNRPPAVSSTVSYPDDKENFIEFVPFIKQPRHIKPLLLGGSEAVL
jgi:hypothetical protein